MILDEEIFFRERKRRVELSVIRESSRLTGISAHLSISVNVRLFSALFVEFEGF